MSNSSKASSETPSPAPVLVRDLRASDREALLAAIVATNAFFPDEVDVAMELIDCGIAGKDDYRFRVAERGGTPTGYACYGPTPLTEGVYDLYWIVVDPSAQGTGIGRCLLDAVEASVREAGGRMVLVETASKPEYAATRAFYDRTGYAEVARVPDFYRPGDDKIVYWKRFGA